MSAESDPLRTTEDTAKWLARRYRQIRKEAVTEREIVGGILADFVIAADLSAESGWPTYLPDDVQPKREDRR